MVLIILVVIMLRQQSKRKWRKRMGCGCSPLGWIVSLLGLGFLFNRD